MNHVQSPYPHSAKGLHEEGWGQQGLVSALLSHDSRPRGMGHRGGCSGRGQRGKTQVPLVGFMPGSLQAASSAWLLQELGCLGLGQIDES